MEQIKLVVADDHPLIRLGVLDYLHKQEKFLIAGDAGNGLSALELTRQFTPDIAILDINMPDMSGFDVCEAIKAENISSKVLLLTLYRDLNLLNKARSVGASGYLLKDSPPEELLKAIMTIYNGDFYLDPELEKFDKKPQASLENAFHLNKNLHLLTKTEKDILLLISTQLTSAEIAAKLFVSEKTIKNHRHNISKKLELPLSQNSLLKFAIQFAGLMNDV